MDLALANSEAQVLSHCRLRCQDGKDSPSNRELTNPLLTSRKANTYSFNIIKSYKLIHVSLSKRLQKGVKRVKFSLKAGKTESDFDFNKTEFDFDFNQVNYLLKPKHQHPLEEYNRIQRPASESIYKLIHTY